MILLQGILRIMLKYNMPVFMLGKDYRFPPAEMANKDGIIAVGGDLSQTRLIHAYSQGIFPWYSQGQPIIWWSPDPRTVLFPEELHISRSMRRVLNQNPFGLSINQNFAEVIQSCQSAAREEDGTWITREMITAYLKLHRAGYAHSVEVNNGEKLVGGFYGIVLGKCFFGESMFYTEANASKYGFTKFVQLMRRQNFLIIDCQISSPHLQNLGARDITRKKYLSLLQLGLKHKPLKWDWQNLKI